MYAESEVHKSPSPSHIHIIKYADIKIWHSLIAPHPFQSYAESEGKVHR